MRNCCSRDLVDPAAHVRDFEPIWLDDYLDYLIVPNKELAPTLTLNPNPSPNPNPNPNPNPTPTPTLTR